VSATTPACVNNSGTVNCSSTGLAAGASVSWTLTVKVDPSYAGTSLANTASIATQTTTDPDTSAASNSSYWSRWRPEERRPVGDQD
jgi:hypothetical protein